MYLITGGCGFIGSHIAETLVREGHRVRILDNLSSGFERNLESFRAQVEFVKGDVRDFDAVRAAMDGVQYVFHEAALVSVFDSVNRPEDNQEINIRGTLNVLLAARDCKARRVVAASSAAVYGNDPALPKREDMLPQPESPYAVAKITLEYYLRMFAGLYGVETVNLRYFNVYGPRQDPGSMYSGVISRFCDAVLAGRDPVIFGDGQQTRDFVFVRDVVSANLKAMRSERAGRGEAYNIGTGRRVSLLDLLQALREITGRTFTTGFKDERKGDIRHSVADVSRAAGFLDFRAEYDIRRGLQELLESARR